MTPLPEGTPVLSSSGRPGVVAVLAVAPSGCAVACVVWQDGHGASWERVEGLRVDGEVGA